MFGFSLPGASQLSAALSAALPSAPAEEAGAADWRADYAPGGHVMCKTCYGMMAEGCVRITRSKRSGGFYHDSKQFFHLACNPWGGKPPAVGELAGLSALTPKDRAEVEAAVGAAARAAAPPET